MADRKVYFNGEFVLEQEARVSIFDSALMFGDMVFEMTRTYRQTPFRLRQHLERAYAGLKYLDIDCGMSIDAMEHATLETLEANAEAIEDAEVQDFGLYQVVNADEAFFTATSFAVMPCTRINGKSIGGGEPGAVTRKLIASWSEMVGVDIMAQADAYAKRVAA